MKIASEGLETARLSQEQMDKLLSAERSINQDNSQQIFLLAVSREKPPK